MKQVHFSSRMVVMLIVTTLFLVNPAESAVPTAQHEALVALYSSTNGASWTIATGWLSGDPCDDSWYGITCDAGGTMVTEIDLGYPGNNLTGSLPVELGDLANLESLELDNNLISGTIPSQLGNLSALEFISLHSNQLTGQIPPELGDLGAINVIYLANNQLSGEIPSELGSLSALQQIYLERNQLNGQIPPELGNLSALRWMYLNRNQLSGPIPPQLSDLEHLQELSLSHNQLTGPIPAELGDLSNLEWLFLHQNQLSGPIPDELGDLTNLERLYLIDNQLSGIIPAALSNLTNLTRLMLDGNQLSGTLPDFLGILTELQYLRLGNNQFTGAIPSSLGNLTNLAYLRLWGNQLVGPVPSSLTNLTLLGDTGLDLRWNRLHTTDPDLQVFLDSKHDTSGWRDTQTIPPTNIQVEIIGSDANLTWEAIEYQNDSGRYRTWYATEPCGPYFDGGTTLDKGTNNHTVSDLNGDSTYYFVVRTETDSHSLNQNDLVSEASTVISSLPDFPRRGMWWNSARSGHGIDLQISGSMMFIVWYTYLPDGSPIWYLAVAEYQSGETWTATLERYAWDAVTRTATPTAVGTVSMEFTDAENGTFSWTLEGESGSEPFARFIANDDLPPVDYTAHWYPPSDSGWGLTVVTQGNVEFTVLYFYDVFGRPVWGLGVFEGDANGATVPLEIHSGFCPNCPTIEVTSEPLGDISHLFDSQTTGVLESDIDYTAAFSGWSLELDWRVVDEPVTMISDPISPVCDLPSAASTD